MENILVSNLRLDTRVRAGNWWGNGEAVCIMSTHHHAYGQSEPERRFPVNVRNVRFQNLICTTENVLAVVGEAHNIRDVHFDGLTVELKDSENLRLKGRMVDVSPSKQVAFLPERGTYWLHLQGVRDITVRNAHVVPFHGEQPLVSEKDCQNISIGTVNG